MGVPSMTVAELVSLARAHRLSELFGAARGKPAIVVDLGAATGELTSPDGELGLLPIVVIGVGTIDHGCAGLADVVVDDADEAHRIAGLVESHPLASTALALLLRHAQPRTVTAGLVAESATYSTLQGGSEFRAWRQQRGARAIVPSLEPAVLVEVDGDVMHVVLNRPARHNAVDVQLSEQLVEVLRAALVDDGRRVVLRGNGPSFCSGGDLDEFGSFVDPASAHAVRLTRSVAHVLHALGDRVEARLHGACLGAGIEWPAFCARVIARQDASIGLPELSLGLVPGAGGTVSLPRRIGRHRTAHLALTGDRIDAHRALEWGLVDAVE